jgi:hypothetical protein
MKAKSAYKPKQKELPPETPEMVAAAISEPAPEPEPERKPEPDFSAAPKVEPQPKPQPPPVAQEDEAAKALKSRLAEIEKSAELNRQYQQAQAAQIRPMSREQLLEQWRHDGVSEANLQFLQRHPEMIDGWQLTYYCANEATKKGHEPNTDNHRAETKRIFDRYLSEANKTKQLAEEPTPEFFKPEAAPAPRRPPGKASIVSAPVSRDAAPGNYQSEFEDNPRSVRLSPDQLEAARIAGVTPTEYARQLIRMRKMQASGEAQP